MQVALKWSKIIRTFTFGSMARPTSRMTKSWSPDESSLTAARSTVNSSLTSSMLKLWFPLPSFSLMSSESNLLGRN